MSEKGSGMTPNIRTDLLVLRAQCGCIKKLFPADEEVWKAEAARDAMLARGSLEVISRDMAFAVMTESGIDCPHQMRWTAKCGLAEASLARFGHLVATTYLMPESTDWAALHRLGVVGGQPFLPGILLNTLKDCIQLSFGMKLVTGQRLDAPVSLQLNGTNAEVVIKEESLFTGAAEAKAVSADAAMLALGAAAMCRLGQSGRADLLVPHSLLRVLDNLRTLTTKGGTREEVIGRTSDLILTLYGTMAAHYLCLDMRIAAVGLWVVEKTGGRNLGGFCASLADVSGSAFNTMSGMERLLSCEVRRGRWLAAETNGDRAAVVAEGAEQLVRSML